MILTIKSHSRENQLVWGYLGLFLGSDGGLQRLLMCNIGALGMGKID